MKVVMASIIRMPFMLVFSGDSKGGLDGPWTPQSFGWPLFGLIVF